MAEEASRLDVTEGVPTAYQRLEVEIEIAGRDPLSSFTYVSSRRHEGRSPSERYMNLLLRGARLHALPAEWIAFLRSFELAADERTSQLEAPSPEAPALDAATRKRLEALGYTV